jgi:hypothetical protein
MSVKRRSGAPASSARGGRFRSRADRGRLSVHRRRLFLNLDERTVRRHRQKAQLRLGRLEVAEAENMTSCGRCGGSWSGTLAETRAAFAEHACS